MEEQTSSEPEVLNISALVTAEMGRAEGGALTVTPLGSIEVEESLSLKYLRLAIGDFMCNQRVFLVVGGKRYEVTADVPEDEINEL